MKTSPQNVNADMENLHKIIMEQIQNKEYDTYMEALADYMERNFIEPELIHKLVSPALRAQILKEAIDRNMVELPTELSDDLFG